MVHAMDLVVLLRGINVGKANRISMKDLQELLTNLGYRNPRTLLQSGNAIVDVTPAAVSSTKKLATASAAISSALAGRGVRSEVILRTGAQLRDAIAADPISADHDPAKHLIGFLAALPSEQAVRDIKMIQLPQDRIHLIGQHVYLYYANGVLSSGLSKSPWGKMLGTSVTTRNWNTVLKLADMLSS